MPFVLTMPKLSPTMEEGTIVKWHVQEGDSFKEGDLLFEVATDKATVEHNALDKGFLRKILINAKQSAIVNQPIAICTETKTESIEEYSVPTLPSAQEACAEEKEPTAKTTATPKSESTPLASFAEPAFIPQPPLETKTTPFATTSQGRLLASPLAKKLARERGVSLQGLSGSGPRGRIIAQDIPEKGKGSSTFDLHQDSSFPLFGGSFEEELLTPMRKTIGKRLQQAKTFIPHFYVTQEVQIDSLMQMREEIKKGGIFLTINDFVVKATALALRHHPVINSGFNSQNQTIIRFQTVDVAIAVALADGLITPIVRHADHKKIQEISQEVRALVVKAKEGKLARHEYMGGSFTLSNLGMFQITSFTAIINPPQAAILAVGGTQTKVVKKDNQFQEIHVFTLTLSADHRVIDGADGARFLITLKTLLESPSLLLV